MPATRPAKLPTARRIGAANSSTAAAVYIQRGRNWRTSAGTNKVAAMPAQPTLVKSRLTSRSLGRMRWACSVTTFDSSERAIESSANSVAKTTAPGRTKARPQPKDSIDMRALCDGPTHPIAAKSSGPCRHPATRCQSPIAGADSIGYRGRMEERPQHPVDEALLAAVEAIAERAGAEILRHYHGAVEARAKADASPVTVADEAAEAVIVPALEALTPEVPVVSEEAVAAGHTPAVHGAAHPSGRFWL